MFYLAPTEGFLSVGARYDTIIPMLAILLTYFFLLGLAIGSFLNVVILRHNTGKTTGGRSACMVCKNQLGWKELVPLFSFLFQRGKCAHCRTRISWQYPLVEFSTAVLFTLNFYYLFTESRSISELILSVGLTSCIWALLVVIFVYDLRHKIIPDVFSGALFVLSILLVLSSRIYSGISWFYYEIPHLRPSSTDFVQDGSVLTYLNLSAGVIFYLVIYAIWKLSNGRLIGLGDAKLLLGTGTILGFVYGLSSIALAAWIGCVYVIFVLLKQRLSIKGKHITMKTEIPFGPFLILGFLIVYFLRIDVTNLGFILENF